MLSNKILDRILSNILIKYWTELPEVTLLGAFTSFFFLNKTHLTRYVFVAGLPWWLSGKESVNQYRRGRFDPWVRKIPWRRAWRPTPVFLPGEFHGQRSLVGYNPWGSQRVRCNWACMHHVNNREGRKKGEGGRKGGERKKLLRKLISNKISVWQRKT